MMKLLTKAQHRKLLHNGDPERSGQDHKPVVKLFTPDAAGTWLLSEIDPEMPDIAFGFADLGLGCPEYGTVSLSELRSVRGALGLPIERDLHFEAKYPLSVYARASLHHQRIVTEDHVLIKFVRKL